MTKTFKKAGWSTRNGILKLRFSTDVYRTRVLERNGHTDINLFDLPEDMTKEDAMDWIAKQRNTPASVKQLVRDYHDNADTTNRNTGDNGKTDANQGSRNTAQGGNARGNSKARDNNAQADTAPRRRGRPRTVNVAKAS